MELRSRNCPGLSIRSIASDDARYAESAAPAWACRSCRKSSMPSEPRLRVESNVGQGSTFTIVFPLGRKSTAALRVVVADSFLRRRHERRSHRVYPIRIRGWRAESGMALRTSSFTIQGMLPSPRSRKFRLAASGVFVGPAEDDFGRAPIVAAQLQADGREHVRDAHAMRDADDFQVAVALDLHQRLLIEVAGVAEHDFDEDDRRRRVEAIFVLKGPASSRPAR